MRPEGGGIGPVNREEGGGPYRVVLLEKQIEQTSAASLADLSESLISAYGTDFGAHSPTWISRFWFGVAAPAYISTSPGQRELLSRLLASRCPAL